MQRQWSLQAPGEPEAEPGGEELCEQEMERLCLSQQPVRVLPYAMVDKRFIRQLREPEGVKTSCWQQWRRRRQTVGRRLGEAARRLTRGCGLWEGALYEIGGLFGTGIQSYFTFLRFLLLLNLLTLLLTSGFILLPLVWLRPPDPGPALNFTLQCPGSGHLPQPGVSKFNNLLWNVFTGRAFNNTYLFYGAYQAGPESSSTYSIRLAYLLSPLACLLLCFCGILRRMVKGLPQKMFLGQDYRSPLSAKVFSSWDFCIRGQEAATIKRHEISNEFKMELEEGRHLLLLQQQTRAQRACHLLTYLRVNILIGLLVVGAISAIFWATKYSQDNKEESLFLLLQYLPPGVIALVNFLGPLLFVFLVQLENYPPNTEVNLTLIWCVVLKLASLGMFSFSLGQTVLCIGRNKTSCESYGYNACDYQVAGVSIRASPLSSAKPHLFDLLAPLWSHLCERLWAELCTQQSPPGSAIRITLPCAEEAAPTGCLSCSPGLDFNLANKTPGTAPILQDPHIRWVRGGWGPWVVTDASSDQCWENSVGEELYKLSIFNFLLTVAFAFLVSLPRRMLVERFSGRFWAWLDREEFLVPKNVLDIVEGQTVTWMGLFYCPLLPLLNSVFIFLTFYIKKLVLLLGLLLAAVPLGYVVSSIRSSWDCGLFTNYLAPWQVVPELVALWLPPPSQRILYYLGSHAFSFPLLILLSLVLTVCISQSQASSRAIRRLRKQLVWQVQEKWHLVDDLSRLLPEPGSGDSLGPESPVSRGSRPRSFCPGFPCPGSPGPRPRRPGSSLEDPAGLRGVSVPAHRFRFSSGSEL